MNGGSANASEAIVPRDIEEVIAEERRCILQTREELESLLCKTHSSLQTGEYIKSDFPVGLALSGGGIRSATFNLGVLQALAA